MNKCTPLPHVTTLPMNKLSTSQAHTFPIPSGINNREWKPNQFQNNALTKNKGLKNGMSVACAMYHPDMIKSEVPACCSVPVIKNEWVQNELAMCQKLRLKCNSVWQASSLEVWTINFKQEEGSLKLNSKKKITSPQQKHICADDENTLATNCLRYIHCSVMG